jgi:hypothetical protein
MSQADPGSGELAPKRSAPALVTIGGQVVNLTPGKQGAATGRDRQPISVSPGSPAPFTPRSSLALTLAGTLVGVALLIVLEVVLIGAIRRRRRLSPAIAGSNNRARHARSA